MAKQVSPRSKREVTMDVESSHSSGTGPIVHYELPTADALEAKLLIEEIMFLHLEIKLTC